MVCKSVLLIYLSIMNNSETATCLAELGNATRLAIFRYLVKMGPKGVPVGDIQKELAIPNSTLSHHISRLSKVELITQTRDGRTLYCKPEISRLQNIIGFLLDECCQGTTSCSTPKTSC